MRLGAAAIGGYLEPLVFVLVLFLALVGQVIRTGLLRRPARLRRDETSGPS